MNATKLQHPDRPKVYVDLGFDRTLGFFIELHERGCQTKFYEAASRGYDAERPLLGALTFLSTHGFYTASELEEALAYRQIGGRKPRRRGAILALAAVAAMKAAADR